MAAAAIEVPVLAPAGGAPTEYTCELCHRTVDECLRLELLSEIVNLCGWNCVIAYAAIRADQQMEGIRKRLAAKTMECAELDELLTLHEAGVF
jgi:hypothetical protein